MSVTNRESHAPILGLSDRTVGILRRTALVWAIVALAILVLATRLGAVDYRPGGDAYALPEQQAFGVGFVLAVLLAVRWEVVGGTLAAVTAAALFVYSRNQLEPVHALLVVAALALPGLLWILVYLHDLRPRTAVLALVLVGLASATGGFVAEDTYDSIYGASHPESQFPELPDSAIEWIWTGAVTDSGAVVSAKVRSGHASVRLAVDSTESLSDPSWHSPEGIAHGVARFVLDGLDSHETFHYAVEVDGVIDHTRAGEFTTFPNGPASFEIAIGSCARVGTNGAVFDAIRAVDPLLFVISGDMHYSNIATNDPAKFREVLDFTLSRTAPAALYRSTPVAYVWDDHDYGGNNADAQSASRPAAMEVYREYVPHYPVSSPDSSIHQAFTVGRVRVIMTDTRSNRSPSAAPDDSNKTMLGEAQKAWLKDELRAANDTFPVILWVNSVPWIATAEPGGDDWSGYSTERRELADFIDAEGIDGLVMASGDAHMVAIDDGTNSDYASANGDGFPILHAAPLDRPGHTKGGPYSHGAFPGGGQFGVISISDDGGDLIAVRLSGRDWQDDELVALELEFPVN